MSKFFRQMGVMLLILLLALTAITPVWAQDEDAEDELVINEKIELAGDFFAAAIDTENFFAAFDDLFDQNACKRRDLFALIKKRDAIGTVIRKGILDSEVTVAEIRKYQRRWELASAEIYFLRNIELLEAGEIQRLANETRNLYPGNELINAKVTDWIEYYSEQVLEYQRCQPTWGSIVKKLDQLETDISEAFDNLATAWSSFTTETINTARSLEDVYDSVLATADKVFSGDFDDFVKVDWGPLGSYLEKTEEKIKKTKIKLDAVENELERDRNASVIDLTKRSVNKAGLEEMEFVAELELINESLAYNHADLVINSLWDEAQETSERITSLKELTGEANDTSLTRNLNLLNELQCRERE